VRALLAQGKSTRAIAKALAIPKSSAAEIAKQIRAGPA
jgi:transposase